MKKLALFDFDKTLISVDSVVEFKNFLNQKSLFTEDFNDDILPFKLPKEQKNFLNKISWLLILEGQKKSFYFELIKEFVSQVLNKSINHKVIDLLKKHTTAGCKVVIISASYKEIIEEFCIQNNLKKIDIIATELNLSKDKFVAEINGFNCSGINKLIKLKNNLDLSSFDLDESYAYTDHISDLSILLLVKNRIVVKMNDTFDDWSHFFKVHYVYI
jgi:HAD superfamily hydrolase (TIGR01490 family)